MKIAFACLANETNSFNSQLVSKESFDCALAKEFFTTESWQRPSVAKGIYDVLKKNKVEIIPLFFARATPGGTVSKDTYEEFINNILNELKKHTDVDAVCWALHGSFFAENYDDPEGHLLALAHQIVPDVPFHVGLDTHATMTPLMELHSSSIAIYKTAPHEDYYEIGELTAQTAIDALNGGYETMIANIKIPLLLSGEVSMTTFEPAKSLFANLSEMEQDPKVISASYALAFPWADSPYLGCNAIVTGKKEDYLYIHDKAKDLANKLWTARDEFIMAMDTATPEDAIQIIKNHNQDKPLIVSDVGDNATAGASQDLVDFLALILKAQLPNVLFAGIYSKSAYDNCIKAGLGSSISLKIGRFYQTDTPLEVKGEIIKFYQYNNKNCLLFRMICGITLIIAEQRIPCADLSVVHATGFDPLDFKTIVIKCGYHGQDLVDISSGNILALTNGDTMPNLKNIPYKRVARPIYPIDKETSF